jgi:hypothetical protein
MIALLVVLLIGGVSGYEMGKGSVPECPFIVEKCSKPQPTAEAAPHDYAAEFKFAADKAEASVAAKYKPKAGVTKKKKHPKRTCVRRELVNVCKQWEVVK